MKSAVSTVLLGLTGLALAGCGSTMHNYLEKDTPAQSASIRQDLTMPPDLRLAPPGTTAAAPDPGALSDSEALAAPPPAAPAKRAASAAPAPAVSGSSGPDSVYTNVGISVYKPDGTRKSDAELREELRQYYLAQKKSKNPNYGTVFNIGNIFKDE